MITRDRSAPIAWSRGRIVVSGWSSADTMMTVPFGAIPPWEGQGPPVETAVAQAIRNMLLPTPPSPATRAISPHARRYGHSHSEFAGFTSATLTRPSCSSVKAVKS